VLAHRALREPEPAAHVLRRVAVHGDAQERLALALWERREVGQRVTKELAALELVLGGAGALQPLAQLGVVVVLAAQRVERGVLDDPVQPCADAPHLVTALQGRPGRRERLLDGLLGVMHWLDPVQAAIDAADAPVEMFFRDDDGGWEHGRLVRLLDLFAATGLPVDLAVIPMALDRRLAAELRTLAALPGTRLGLHQHGLAHRNHEPEGRKFEFGPSRSPSQQRHDIRPAPPGSPSCSATGCSRSSRRPGTAARPTRAAACSTSASACCRASGAPRRSGSRGCTGCRSGSTGSPTAAVCACRRRSSGRSSGRRSGRAARSA
jgi:hypothetical protein